MDLDNEKLIRYLIRNALDGELLFETFQEKWDTIEDDNDFLELLYDDLEDAVNHCPRLWSTPELDVDTWQKQKEYGVLLCDLLLFKYYKGQIEDWKKLRKILLNSLDVYDEISIQKKIDLIMKEKN